MKKIMTAGGFFLAFLAGSVSQAYASEVTGTFGSGAGITTGISGTVTAPTPTPAVTPSRSSGGGGGSRSSVTVIQAAAPAQSSNSGFSGASTAIGVKGLQKFLNLNGFVVAASGPGSPGKETDFLGVLTKKALLSFQREKGLAQTGVLDAPTAMLVTILSSTAPVAVVPATAVSGSTFSRDIEKGNSGTDVRSLQKFLNARGYVVAASGAGSPGNESNFFGEMTKRALAQFQKSVGINPTGVLGPKTRAYIGSI